jgi:tetratricopeptide (TPR) repeat protein
MNPTSQGKSLPPERDDSTVTADTPASEPVADNSLSARMSCIGDYELGEEIARGGMGAIYRAHDRGLDRDLAVKVLRSEHRDRPDLVRRFVAEALVLGRLQHPAIPPIHGRGELPDGRPFLAMKLICGETFFDLLHGRQHPAEDLPSFLGIFEQVCQAMAHAHSRAVIHRDLKPSNVMVGSFGEVQVLDWGLAKLLPRRPRQPASAGTPDGLHGGGPAEASGKEGETVDQGPADEEAFCPLQTQSGQAVGTPAYMPPEQARGEVGQMDERSDVFGLGAILCEVLTGLPPFTSCDSNQPFDKVRASDHAEALVRLDGCGADAELVRLAKGCLAEEPAGRPRDAGQVAEAVKAYRAGVEERLRAAERERAAAQARAEEARKTVAAERRARRRMAWAALAGLLLIVGTGGGAWWLRQRQQTGDTASRSAIAQARLLLEQARQAPLADGGKFHEALEAGYKAEQLAAAGGASTAVREQAAALVVELEREAEEAAKDRRLLAALLEVRGPREGPKFSRDDRGMMMALAEPTAEEQFASAFRAWGLDVDAAPTAEAAARLKARPAAVVTEVIAALDEWASQRRQDRKPEEQWRRLADLAAALDDEPGSLRRELRDILARGQLPVERALAVLSAALRPVPIPVEVPLGRDRLRLRQIAEQSDAASEPILGLLTLVRALRVAGEEAQAEQLLRAAIRARPCEVVLYHSLGQLLTDQQPPRWAEAVECYAAARVGRPNLGVNLATALLSCGRDREGLALLARLTTEMPTNPYLHFRWADALRAEGRLDEAVAEYHKAIALDPGYVPAHNNLGNALHDRGRLDEAMAEYHEAIALDSGYAIAHGNLGAALYEKGQWNEALTELRQAITLAPRYAQAHNNLGTTLAHHRRWDEAMAEYRQALALAPRLAGPHVNLGVALAARQRWEEAMAEYRTGIALDPSDAVAHYNLGNALRANGRVDEAIAEYQKAIALAPNLVAAHHHLGNALYGKKQLDEAIAEYQKALTLDPRIVVLHYNLGNALHNQGRLDEALAQFRHALALDPRFAPAHGSTGLVLLQQGRFAAARESTQHALELLSRDDPLRRLVLPQLQQCDRLLALDRKLSALLAGETPANAREAVAVATMCQQYKKRYATSARLYSEAFAASPKLAADLNLQHRFNAACSAALAAAGQGEDARLLPDRVVVMFRRWALGWLRDDLTAYSNLAGQDNLALKRAIQQRLTAWQSDPDLASVRESQALDRLPENERADWQALWRDVAALLQHTRQGSEGAGGPRAQPPR